MNKFNQLALVAIGKCDQMEKVSQATSQYLSTISSVGLTGTIAPIIVKFDFNYDQLLAESSDFLELLLFEPVQCLSDLREATWLHVSALIEKNRIEGTLRQGIRDICLQQIHCSIRFTGLPMTEEEFIFRPFTHPVRFGVTVMHCVLSGLAQCGTFIQQSIWYCPSKCVGNDFHVIGRCPFDWTQDYICPACTVCTRGLMEHVDYRKVAEYRLIKVHLVENARTQHRSNGWVKWSVTVQLVDDLCDVELKLGDEYIVIGNYDPKENRFNAWSITSFK